MKISVSYDFLPKTPTAHAAVVMDHFGIDFEQGRHFIAQELELPIQAGDVVLFTGPSGSGKSSLLRIASQQLEGVINVDSLDLGNSLLVDSLGWPVREGMELLAGCGLGEAHLMLRTPVELSEGQRYRFRLAKALSERPGWIVADEFSATLDRTLARVVAYNIRKLATRHKTGFLLATTHEDIVEDLNPDVWVRCDLSGEIQIERREPQKKSRSVSRTTCGSRPARGATGRISLAGITAATT